MKKATAFIDWQLDIDCPHCGKSVDLVDYNSENDYQISKHIFNNNWDALRDWDIECPHCKHDFQIDHVEY